MTPDLQTHSGRAKVELQLIESHHENEKQRVIHSLNCT